MKILIYTTQDHSTLLENVAYCGNKPEQAATMATHKQTKLHAAKIMS